MISLYSSFYNVEVNTYPWRDTLTNWQEFLHGHGEIVIAVNTSTDNSAQLIRDFAADYVRRHAARSVPVKVVDASIPYDDPEFDGKLKALALSNCTQPICTLLDCDEVLAPATRDAWFRLARDLQNQPNLDAFMVPVVDVYGDERHYRCDGNVGLASKWYLHKRHPNITRGVVKWAYRENGSIDITRSDSTELIFADSRELVRSAPIMMPIPHFIQITQMQSGGIPFVYHIGGLSKEQRAKQDAFWEPVWRNRDKSDVKTAKTVEEIAKVKTFPHNLPKWRGVQ